MRLPELPKKRQSITVSKMLGSNFDLVYINPIIEHFTSAISMANANVVTLSDDQRSGPWERKLKALSIDGVLDPNRQRQQTGCRDCQRAWGTGTPFQL